MKAATILLFLTSCTVVEDKEAGGMADLVIESNFDQDVRKGLLFTITTKDRNLTSNNLKKRIVVMRDPQTECLTPEANSLSVPVTIKKSGLSFQVITKQALPNGSLYGIYILDETTAKNCLRHIFRARGSLQLIDHDLGSRKIISPDHRRIRLTFDQPIKLVDPHALRLVSTDLHTRPRLTQESEPLIGSIVMSLDQKSLILHLVEGRFSPGANYLLDFGASITNNLGWPLNEKPFNISVAMNRVRKSKLLSPHFAIDPDGVTLSGPLLKHATTEMFIKESSAKKFGLVLGSIASVTTKNLRQPLFSKTCSPWASSGAAGLSACLWHWPQEAWMYCMGNIGSSQYGTLPCASTVVVARPWPRWQIVQPNRSKGCCSCRGW